MGNDDAWLRLPIPSRLIIWGWLEVVSDSLIKAFIEVGEIGKYFFADENVLNKLFIKAADCYSMNCVVVAWWLSVGFRIGKWWIRDPIPPKRTKVVDSRPNSTKEDKSGAFETQFHQRGQNWWIRDDSESCKRA
ncbi:hypothetical protein AVEN_101494-1 [Araneus ventricosus]|uniref:Uncharacterized protein n=1 Tax=Araneus ventricosus TaxID=182803 RepID=A0A4Y2F9G0_ARAVE|nr:hypothetical protein AVEN_101494-1 [Araneus ventricosus]